MLSGRRQTGGEADAMSGVIAVDMARLGGALTAWEEEGIRLVLTNGCFDLLHPGHLRYLRAARALGDRLIVALNGDDSVRRLKGPGRPILPWADRAELLAGLRAVDAVVGFQTDDAVDVVRATRPAVYVKGGDYGPGRWPPEADVAAALGAKVQFLSFSEGQSTSRLLERIRMQRGDGAGLTSP